MSKPVKQGLNDQKSGWIYGLFLAEKKFFLLSVDWRCPQTGSVRRVDV